MAFQTDRQAHADRVQLLTDKDHGSDGHSIETEESLDVEMSNISCRDGTKVDVQAS